MLDIISLALKHGHELLCLHKAHKFLKRFSMSLTQRIQMQELRPYPFILFVKLRGEPRALFW